MSITRNRELSQFGSFIYIDDPSGSIGIATEATPNIGIGTFNATAKLHVVGTTRLEGNVTVIDGNVEASSYTLNGDPLVQASVSQWTYASNEVDIYRLNGNVGIGTSVLTEKLNVGGNISAGRFISTVTSGTAPFSVLSDTQVPNLNASFLRGKTPPSGDIVGTTDSQTLTNKTLTSPSITNALFGSTGVVFNGSTSGNTTLRASAIASGTLTLPTVTDTLVGKATTDTFTNKTISASNNTITGIGSTNLSPTAGILNTQLANSTISGISLGSNLNSLSFSSYLTSDGNYNGSTARTISVDATSDNTASKVVARDSNGDFSAGTIGCSNLTASFNVSANALRISTTEVIDSSRNLVNIESFDSTVKSIWDTVTVTATGKTLVNREHCTVTAQGQTIILPASPQVGWEVVVAVDNFTNTIINRNGQNIMGLAEDMTINVAYAALTFIYTGASQGWRIY